MPTFQIFKDISVTFNEHPNTKDLLVVKEQQAVKIAMQNLVMTSMGERPFQSLLGSNIKKSLFDLLDFGTAATIQSDLYLLFARYEPRVKIIDILVTPEFDANAYSVRIEFEIIGREAPNSVLTTEFILERTK